ncbi:SAM-dependent methyltransferase [Streptomyces sp. ICBB 8177]|uniref:SAM-dependent methyltransferase n=1 Tax=Streptomyces sp. ICBB 8177 TaxID=563922 RepID=UPI000D6760D7|nr:SAM-dependent methyltransferase [Streptomyces sp. ICBB 8177]PWI45117.1 methyltransferase [Streptomyces sp. ICBB 8177]
MDTPEWMRARPRTAIDLRTDRPHAARVYDVLLGGKTNYPADRAQAAAVAERMPSVRIAARVNRAFVMRSARELARAGMRQFLDIGTGIPMEPNLHDTVQRIDPACRVVYVDNDPIVLAHSRALHTSDPRGRTAYIDADASRPETVLGSGEVTATLRLDEPVALFMCLFLHWLPATTDPYEVVGRLLEALAPGSHLVITHLASDITPATVTSVEDTFQGSGSEVHGRDRDQVARFFTGLRLVEPGLVTPQHWRPDDDLAGVGGAPADDAVPVWAGVAVKP